MSSILLKGGKGNYKSKTLIGNWKEDREVCPVMRTTQAAGFETTKGVAEHETTCKKKVYFGNDIQSSSFTPSSTMAYQGKEITGEPTSIARMSYQNRNNEEFQKMFGSRFPLQPARTLEGKEMEEYHETFTFDKATREERFLTEKVSFQNKAVGRAFRVNQMRLLPNVPTAIQSLQEALIEEHGVHAMHLKLKVFMVYDANGNMLLERNELAALLEDLDVSLKDDEMSSVWNFFDRNGSGAVDYTEFVSGLCGEFAQQREQAVRAAYAQLLSRVDSSSHLTESQLFDMMTLVDTGDNSEESQVAREFFSQWPKPSQDWESQIPPLILEGDFVRYYKLLSPAFPDTERFLALVQAMWL